jgi:hypothetical protein
MFVPQLHNVSDPFEYLSLIIRNDFLDFGNDWVMVMVTRIMMMMMMMMWTMTTTLKMMPLMQIGSVPNRGRMN